MSVDVHIHHYTLRQVVCLQQRLTLVEWEAVL